MSYQRSIKFVLQRKSELLRKGRFEEASATAARIGKPSQGPTK